MNEHERESVGFTASGCGSMSYVEICAGVSATRRTSMMLGMPSSAANDFRSSASDSCSAVRSCGRHDAYPLTLLIVFNVSAQHYYPHIIPYVIRLYTVALSFAGIMSARFG